MQAHNDGRFKPGFTPWNKGRTRATDPTLDNIAKRKEGKKRPNLSGPLHWNWKGGKTTEAMRIRNSMEYAQWRAAVLTNGGHKCALCGSTEKLEADHIKAFAEYPELRLDVSNGRALCAKCHRRQKWATRKRTFTAEHRAALAEAQRRRWLDPTKRPRRGGNGAP